jgi:hypothetical protein
MRPQSESDRSSEGPRLVSRGSFVKLLISAAAAPNLALVVHPRGAAAVSHPRLMLTAAEVNRLKTSVPGDADLKGDSDRIGALADMVLSQPVPTARSYSLHAARESMERMFTLGASWHLTGNTQHADRGIKELMALCDTTSSAVKNWAPDKWLTMGDSAMAVAIGYDWLFSRLTSTQKSTVKAAAKARGFDVYLARPDSGNHPYNWNGVTNGGVGVLALSLQGESSYESTLSSVLSKVDRWLGEGGFANLDKPAAYRDNIINLGGGYKEGPQYWGAHLRFLTYFLASWLTCKGTHNHWLGDCPGLRQTVDFFYAGCMGPTGTFFRFSDCDYQKTSRHFTHIAGWHGKVFSNPAYKFVHKDGWRVTPSSRVDGQDAILSMLWKDGDGSLADYPLDHRYERTDVVSMRSAWGEPEALYVASRVGGDVDRGHTHLDRGSFVLQALGHEWFCDLGSESYSVGSGSYDQFYKPSIEYADRWKIYRLRAEGHNTLVINPDAYPDQRAGKEESNFIPSVEKTSLNTASPFVITDLTPVYSGRAPWKSVLSVKRGLKMENRSSMIVQDEIRAFSGATIWWFAHAETKKSGASMTLSADGTEATLVKDSSGKRLWCKLLSPAGARFAVMPARRLSTSPPGYANENPNATYEKLAIRLTNMTTAAIVVYIKPLRPGEVPPRAALPRVVSLANW